MRPSPDPVEAAYLASREGRPLEAVELAKAALGDDPENERLHLILAQALDNSGQTLQAAEIVARLIQLGSERRDLPLVHANLLRKAGKLDAALASAQAHADRNPNDADGQAFVGVMLIEAGKTGQAADLFQSAVRLDPGSAPHRYNLALALIRLERDQEAFEVLKELASLAPGFGHGQLSLAQLFLKHGRHGASADAARKAIAAEPQNPGGHILLAQALTEGAGYGSAAAAEKEAEEHLRTALTFDPRSSSAHALLGFALQQGGKFDDAVDAFRASLRLNPHQGNLYYGIAGCRKFGEDDGGFVDSLTQLLESDRLAAMDRAYVHFALGKVLEDQRRFEAALAQFDAGNSLMFELNAHKRRFDSEELERYVSAVTATFDSAFFEAKRGSGSDSEAPLIVLGMMRSGTTLVEQILSSHPSIAGGGELTFWPEHARSPLSGLDLTAAEMTELADQYLKLLREIGPDAERVTDKMPQNTLYLGTIHAVFPRARIIHCRRHPVDTCLSIYTTPYGASPDFAHNRAHIVAAYRQYQRLMAHWRTVISPDLLLEVDYEELVADRDATARRMIEFCGLQWDERCLHHESNRRSVKTPSKWQVRQPIYRSSVARWRNYEPWLDEFALLLPDEGNSATKRT